MAERTVQARQRAAQRYLQSIGFTMSKVHGRDQYVVTDNEYELREGFQGGLAEVEVFVAELKLSLVKQARDRLAGP